MHITRPLKASYTTLTELMKLSLEATLIKIKLKVGTCVQLTLKGGVNFSKFYVCHTNGINKCREQESW